MTLLPIDAVSYPKRT